MSNEKSMVDRLNAAAPEIEKRLAEAVVEKPAADPIGDLFAELGRAVNHRRSLDVDLELCLAALLLQGFQLDELRLQLAQLQAKVDAYTKHKRGPKKPKAVAT